MYLLWILILRRYVYESLYSFVMETLAEILWTDFLNFWWKTLKRNFIQNVANVLTGRNSAQCRVGRANDNEKTIRKATCVPGGGGGTWLADGQGSAARFSERYPLLITESCRHTHFYDEFWRKTTHFLLFFANFWITHPCLWKMCRKRDPCLENLGPKNPPIWAAHTLNMLCTPPPGHVSLFLGVSQFVY